MLAPLNFIVLCRRLHHDKRKERKNKKFRLLSPPGHPDPHQCNVGNEPVPDEHNPQCNGGDALPIKPHLLDPRIIPDQAGGTAAARVRVAGLELRPHQELVRVVAYRQVPDPGDEGGHVLDVVPAGEEEREHQHRPEDGRRLLVHDQGADGEPEALRHEDAVEEHEERAQEVAGRGLHPGHPVRDDDEDGGEDELHREVARDAGHEVGGEPVHARRPLLLEHHPFLGESEDGVEEGEEAPERRVEEEEPNLHDSNF